MLNLQEIEDSIKDLEESSTTYDNCARLASLYIVRDRLKQDDVVEDELNDVLPSYRQYVKVKRKYQMKETTSEALCTAFNSLCNEINEFLHTLYACTETEQERAILKRTALYR